MGAGACGDRCCGCGGNSEPVNRFASCLTEQDANRPQEPDLPSAVEVEPLGEDEIRLDEAGEQDAEMADACEQTLGAARFETEIELMLQAPVNGGRQLSHPLLPEALGEFVDAFVVFRAVRRCLGGDGGIEARGHQGAESENTGRGGLASERLESRRPEVVEGQNQVEHVAEAFEAMARAVQAEEEPLVRRCQQPGGDAFERRRHRAAPGGFDIEVEGQRVLHIMMELDSKIVAQPGAMVVIASALRPKSDGREQFFGASDVVSTNQQIEIAI